MKNASCWRTISLGDLEDGTGALIQRSDQPVGGLQALVQVIAVLLAPAVLETLACSWVDQHPWQRVGIQLEDPASIGAGRTNTSGTTACICTEPNSSPGLGLRRRISEIMSARSSISTSTAFFQGRQVVLGEQGEIVEQAGDCGIIAVSLPELDGQAFRRGRAMTPTGSKFLAEPEHLQRPAGEAPSLSATWARSVWR